VEKPRAKEWHASTDHAQVGYDDDGGVQKPQGARAENNKPKVAHGRQAMRGSSFGVDDDDDDTDSVPEDPHESTQKNSLSLVSDMRIMHLDSFGDNDSNVASLRSNRGPTYH
jgi:hypothetical protein